MKGKYFLIFLLLTLFSECYSNIQCYDCSSNQSGTCSPTIVQCPESCFLLRFTTGGPKIIKGCAPVGGKCSTLISLLKFQYPNMSVNKCDICNKKLCNSASTINSTLVFAIIAATLMRFFG